MDISLIVAFDENQLIGKDNALPWHLPADLKHFKSLTMGHYLIMGRKTFESIGKALPGRISIIVTRQPDYHAESCITASSLSDAFAKCTGHQKVFVIGGAQIFNESLPAATHLFTTVIHHAFEGDTWFPEINENDWEVISRERHDADEKNKWDYTFVNYKRK